MNNNYIQPLQFNIFVTETVSENSLKKIILEKIQFQDNKNIIYKFNIIFIWFAYPYTKNKTTKYKNYIHKEDYENITAYLEEYSDCMETLLNYNFKSNSYRYIKNLKSAIKKILTLKENIKNFTIIEQTQLNYEAQKKKINNIYDIKIKQFLNTTNITYEVKIENLTIKKTTAKALFSFNFKNNSEYRLLPSEVLDKINKIIHAKH